MTYSDREYTANELEEIEMYAFDTLYIGCEKFPQHDIYNFDGGGVM